MKMHCQQFTFKSITLAHQILQVKPVFSPGSISLRYCEFVSNKHSNFPSVSGPSVAVGPRNNVPAGPPLIGPAWAQWVSGKKWTTCPNTMARGPMQLHLCIGLRPALVSLHYPPQMSAFSSHMRRNAYCRDLKWIFVAMFLLRNKGQFYKYPHRSFATCLCSRVLHRAS